MVEIIKSGAPRFYQKNDELPKQPPKGSVFKLSDTEAFLVSSLPPYQKSTPHPLYIRTEPPFLIEDAIDSVLSFTFLHFGSLRPPRLPVTIHYSDKIAKFILKGIKPNNPEGEIMFWL